MAKERKELLEKMNEPSEPRMSRYSLSVIMEFLPISFRTTYFKRVNRECYFLAYFDQYRRKMSNELQYFYIEIKGNEDQYVAPQSILNQMKWQFEFIESYPAYLFVFCTSPLTDTLKDADMIIPSLVHTACKCFLVAADYITGVLWNRSVGFTSPAVLWFAIPYIEELQFFEFLMEPKSNIQDVSNVLAHDRVKAILIFPNHSSYDDEILRRISTYYNRSPVVGGTVKKIMITNSRKRAFYCIALCGGRSVHIASVVINDNIADGNEIKKTLRRRESAGDPKFAFMFSTIAKETIQVQTAVFREVFQTTPLFGFQGNGIVGIDPSNNLPKQIVGTASVFLLVYGSWPMYNFA